MILLLGPLLGAALALAHGLLVHLDLLTTGHEPFDRLLLAGSLLTAIGDVLSGAHPGRRSPDEITVFDSSGLSLQDLHVARHLLAKRANEA